MGFWVYFSDDKVEYYDSDACELYLLSDGPIPIESDSKIIFDYLIENRNIALSRDQIYSRIDGIDLVTNSKYRERSPVDQAICTLRKKLNKYSKHIQTIRKYGYKYVGPPKVEKEPFHNSSDSDTLVENGERCKQNIGFAVGDSCISQSKSNLDDVHSSKENIVKLASVLIHEGDHDHPAIAPALELEINNIIELLEQGLSDDFEEVCEQAWQDLTLMQKAFRIFKAYENLTDRVRNMSQSDTNARM